MGEPRRSAGTLYRERQKLPWPADEPFRILSIDGGGIKGILPAALLTLVEQHLTAGVSAGRYFDMIAGTSTGGIMALGLGRGMTAGDILNMYLTRGAAIFPRTMAKCNVVRKAQSAWRAWNDLHRYRYDTEALDSALRTSFGDALFGASERRLVIPAFDQNNEVFLFKTPHHADYKQDWERPMVKVARATSAAPTYFRAFADGHRRYLDGGVWANNPLMCAVVDALACYDMSRRAIEVLTIGCADDEFLVTGKHETGGILAWKKIMSAAAQLQSQNAIGQARLLLGGDLVLRIDGSAPRSLEIDDYFGAAEMLPELARKLFEQDREKLAPFFAEERPVYTAFYGPRT